MAKIDAPEIKSAVAQIEKVYVEVPEKDLFEMTHTDIIINGHHFGPGRHFVSVELGKEIERLLKQFSRSQVRLLQPTRDSKALGIVERDGASRGGNSAHPDSF